MIKSKKLKWILTFGFVLVLFFMIACDGNNSQDTETPQVPNVTIIPNNADGNVILVPAGTFEVFRAEVTGNTDTYIEWEVLGTVNDGTWVGPPTGMTTTLGVASTETAGTLRLRAIPTIDPSRYAEVIITVQAGTVTGVTVTPTNVVVIRGETQQFNAIVGGTAADTVTWSVTEQHNDGTTINENGLLTVNAGETASSLTVTATSTVNTSFSSSISVGLISIAEITNVWLTLQTDGTWSLPGYQMIRNSNVFTWSGEVPNAVNNFRFGLSDAANRNWLAPMYSTHAVLEASGNAVSVFSGNITQSWILPGPATYDFSLDISSMTLNIVRPASVVDTVTVNAPNFLTRGSHHDFTATLTGVNAIFEPIIWEVIGATEENTRFGTGAYANRLTISLDETANTLTVRATAGGVTSADAVIEVRDRQIWLLGNPAANGWTKPGDLMIREGEVFVWTGTMGSGLNYFRFNLSSLEEIPEGNWFRVWFAPSANGVPAVIGAEGNQMMLVETDANFTWTVQGPGSFRVVVNPASMMMFVTQD